MKKTILTTSLLGLLTVASQATVIITEDFASIGDWTFDVNSDSSGGNLTSTSVGAGTNTSIHEDGAAADADNEGTLTRTFSTVGFNTITLDFSAFQGLGSGSQSGTFEGSESFDFAVDTGGGFVSLGGGPIAGRLSTGAAGTASAADVFTLTNEALGAGADNGSFDVKITIKTGYTDGVGTGGSEEYILENLVVNATAVPEPSSTALLGLGGLALILRRRK